MPPVSDPDILIELLYSIFIIAASLIIYISTKELYELSSHKGIKYFRNAFMFFAIAFFFRFVIRFVIIIFNLPRTLHIYPVEFGIAILFVYIYASTMAMFYLLYSIMWKESHKGYDKVPFLHLTALAVSIICIIISDILILLFLQIVIFLFIAIESYRVYTKSKKKKGMHKMYTVYLLLFAFWMLTVIDILIPDFLHLIQMLMYLASAIVFMLILYEVLEKSGVISQWKRKKE